MKKVLILTVTAGNAHNACALSMKRKLEESGEVEVQIIDLLQTYSTKLNAWVSDEGYAIAVSNLLAIYNAFYNGYTKLSPYDRYSCPSQSTVLSFTDGLLKGILEFRPDVVYITHFYGSIAMTNLKLVYNLPCISIASALDYIISPFWESGIGVDYFAIPNEDFIDDCIYKGYRREQLLPVGFPVDGRTLDVTDKRKARKALNLDENLFTVMVMFGGGMWSGGYRIFKQLITALEGREAQIIMINGKNEVEFKKVEKTPLPSGIKVKNVGFTTDIPLYLSATDVIINKCGGASATETLNKSIPMLVTEKLAAQEMHNLVYLKDKGVALSFNNAKQLKKNILTLMDNDALRKEMTAKTLPLKKDAIGELAKFILKQPAADYSEILSENIDFSEVKEKVRQAVKLADKEEKLKKKI